MGSCLASVREVTLYFQHEMGSFGKYSESGEGRAAGESQNGSSFTATPVCAIAADKLA